MVPRFESGDNTYKNQQLLYQHCHNVKTTKNLKANY
ncbi:hypothetical protein [Trichodesmium erythraeum]